MPQAKQWIDSTSLMFPFSLFREHLPTTTNENAPLIGRRLAYWCLLFVLVKGRIRWLSSRMALIRRSDIEKMFETNPYNRVLPCTKSKKTISKKKTSVLDKKQKSSASYSDEVLEYYSSEEVKQKFKVKQSWLYASAKRHQIPMCRIAGRNYYSKKHIDAVFGTTIDLDAIVDWLSPQEVADRYGINLTAVRSYAHRHKIPSKREYGHIYYSQSHFDELRRTDLLEDENYYTVEQVQQLYGLTKANICHIVKVKHIEKTKVGRLNLLLRSDVERVMEERKSVGMIPSGF